MFDTHCHLNFKAFKNNYDQVIRNANQVGVQGIVIPGTDVETSKKAVEIAEKYDGVYAAVGIHPHHACVGVGFPDPLLELEKLIAHPKVVAIGEVGLDKHEYRNTKYETYLVDDQFVKSQKEILIGQIKLAIKYEKSLILHNREAKKEMLEILSANWDKQFEEKTVFHCCEPDFVGIGRDLSLLNFAIKHQMFIGVDGDVTYSKEKQEFVKKIPLEILVLETDSPYLLPEPLRSQKLYPNKPENIVTIVDYVARLRDQGKELIQKVTTENAKKLFQIEVK